MLLAGDVGGTKTLLGLFERSAPRPLPKGIDEFVTLEHESLEAIIGAFLRARGVEPAAITAASIGIAGAITDQVAQLTNVPWFVDAASVAASLGLAHVQLLNDLEALAWGVAALAPDELAVLQKGEPVASGNAAVIAAGTGLGEALLLNVDGRFVPGESEGGHADFAARTPRELEMVAALTRVYGRVSAEHVLSGPGLVNIYQFTHDAFGTEPATASGTTQPARGCAGVPDVSDVAELPARISAAAAERRCARCVEAMGMFVSAYGAEAGNLALRAVATAGIYVGGGIAPRILPALRNGDFMTAFRAKPPMERLVSRIPVAVILNARSGLLGAAVHASLTAAWPAAARALPAREGGADNPPA